jgi:hypothetical protein
MTYEQILRLVLATLGRHRRIAHVPIGLVRRGLRLTELLVGPAAPATWDEVALLELTLLAADGTADVERLGVTPRPMADVLAG